MSLRPRIARLARLPRAERRVLLQAGLLLAAHGVGLRAVGLRRVLLAWPVVVAPRAGLPATSIARLVEAAARHGPLRPGCLTISLTLQRLLARHGLASDLRFGVRKLADGIEAHAWIERDGEVLLDVRDAQARFHAFEEAIACPREPGR